jgi:hypothetical protein
LLGSFPSADYVLLAELALIGEIREIEEFLFFRRDHAERSRRANVKPADVAEWFAPGGGERPVREFSRLFVEHLRVIRSAPVGRGERIRCFLAFADAWLRRNGVFLVEEWTGLSYTGGAVPFRRQRRG